MNLYRKRALAGLAATGIVAGALAGGGVAVASTSPPQSPTATATAPASGQCSGWRHMHDGHHGIIAKAIAGYLDLSEAQLLRQLESGKSLADVARAQGKPVSGLENTILAAVTTQVNAVTGISAAQKAALISLVQSHLDEIVNYTCSPGMSGHPTGSPMPSSPMPGTSTSYSPTGTMPGM